MPTPTTPRSKIMAFLENLSNSLSGAEQRVFRALYIDGVSPAAVSASLQMPQGQVDDLNSSVLRKLRGA